VRRGDRRKNVNTTSVDTVACPGGAFVHVNTSAIVVLRVPSSLPSLPLRRVLQRDRVVNIWGYATPGVQVTTSFNNALFGPATASASGQWLQVLPATAAGGPFSLVFTASDGGAATLQDVLFGDVHLCGGQSNMQFTLLSNAGVPNATAEIADANNYPNIRVMTVGQGNSSAVPFTELASIELNWAAASNLTIGAGGWSSFSAVCWFTYRDVFNALGGAVPQGLISNNWGGTPIEHWSSAHALSLCGDTSADSTLWNAMIMPYAQGPMALRTAIWYQGEANVGNAIGYDCKLRAMIADWRITFPGLRTFGIVQIAPCNCYGTGFDAADLRQAQLAPLASLPNIAWASTLDLVYPFSAPADIHPTYKQAVGARMANSLLAVEYGVDTPHTSPMYAGAVAETNGAALSVTIELTGCLGGCTVTPGMLPPGVPVNVTDTWAIQTGDAAQTWWSATAGSGADGRSIILAAIASQSGLPVIATRYGRAPYPLASAANSIGLPVMPWCFTMAGAPCYNATSSALVRSADVGAVAEGVWAP